jgi:hypothetical protein
MNWKAFLSDPRFSCLAFIDYATEDEDGATGATLVMKFFLPGDDLGSVDVETFYADTEKSWGYQRAQQMLRLMDDSRVASEFSAWVEPRIEEYDD